MYAYRHTHSYIHPPKHPYRDTHTHTQTHTHTHTQSFEFPLEHHFITLIPTLAGSGKQGVGELHHIFYFTNNALVQRQEKSAQYFFDSLESPSIKAIGSYFKCIKLKKE